MRNDLNFGHVLGRSEMKKIAAGSSGGDCSGCGDCFGNGCSSTVDDVYCGMIQDTRDGSYTSCYRSSF